MAAGTWGAFLLCVLGALPQGAAAEPRVNGPLAAEVEPRANAELAAKIDAVTSEWLTATAAPSVSIAIVQGGALVYARTYGRTPSRRYAIDSLTKEFTAAAVLLLAERGLLSLEDPLRTWFPDSGPAAQVTLRQLLTHTSGIRDYWPQDFVTPEMRRPVAAAGIVAEWVTQRPLDFAPGSEWQYSNTNYLLAGLVVERVAGQSLMDFLRHQIFGPLVIGDAADEATPESADDATGFTRAGLGPVRPAAREGAGWLFGAAALRMTASDLAAWDISLVDRSLLQARSYELQETPAVLNDGTRVPYGLGLDVEQVRGRLRLGHSGSGSGFLSDNRVWPAERAAIVVLTNNDWASPNALSNRLASLILPPSPIEARARAVFAGLQKGMVDRSAFTAIGNDYLNDATLADLREGLGGLGPARDVELERESQRGGMITRHWKILCRHARLEAIERGYAGGKLDEFMIVKRQD